MKIVVDLDPTTYERIKQLVVRGEYESVAQFLRAGADNQLTIEDSSEKPLQPFSSEVAEPPNSTDWPSSETVDAATKYSWEFEVPSSVPTRQPYPADRTQTLLFAQYYRYLPLKFVLWQLAIESAETEEPLKLNAFRDHVAETVIPVRDAIVEWEEREGIPKGAHFSTAFPKKDASDPERTMRRYLNHYVGHYQSRKGTPSGFGHDLGLVSIEATEKKDVTIQLTESGIAFAQLTNPVLANGPESAEASLSEAERNYLVTHIRRNLDLEYEFMEFVYDTLEHHDETYTNLLGNFRSFLENTPQFGSDSSENQVRSHTAGTISRMISIGALKRGNRRGVYETAQPLNKYRYHGNVETDNTRNHKK